MFGQMVDWLKSWRRWDWHFGSVGVVLVRAIWACCLFFDPGSVRVRGIRSVPVIVLGALASVVFLILQIDLVRRCKVSLSEAEKAIAEHQ
jgi:hypothetical protein